MGRRKAVFDIDDTCWGFNDKVCHLTGIDKQKIITYNFNKNPLLSNEEKEKLRKAYSDETIFEHIKFYPDFGQVKRLMAAGIDVFFNSNCGNKKIKELKYQQIKASIDVPGNHIILNIIDDTGIHCKKEIGEDIDFFVDDNPDHIAESGAKFNFMMLQPWNEDGQDIEKYSKKTVIPCTNLYYAVQAILERADMMEYEEDLMELKKKNDAYKAVPRNSRQHDRLSGEYHMLLKKLAGKYHMDATNLRISAGI